MRVCFVSDSDPDRHSGGTPAVVREIMKRFGGCKVSGSRNAIMNIFLMALAPFRILMGDCDIVNMHDTQGYFYTFVPRRKKIVCTCHGLWENYYKIMPPASRADRIKSFMAKRFQRRILEKSDHITAVSESVKRQIMNAYGIDGSKITVIYNGVDTSRFKTGKPGRGFIWVGDNPELKGLAAAIEYARYAGKRIIVAGVEGKSDGDILYMGKVPHEKMPEIYRMADTLLFFSRFEGHPLVPLEAAACGLNIIASKESNIEILPLKRGMYRSTGKQGRRTAERYDWSLQARKYMKIFEEFS